MRLFFFAVSCVNKIKNLDALPAFMGFKLKSALRPNSMQAQVEKIKIDY